MRVSPLSTLCNAHSQFTLVEWCVIIFQLLSSFFIFSKLFEIIRCGWNGYAWKRGMFLMDRAKSGEKKVTWQSITGDKTKYKESCSHGIGQPWKRPLTCIDHIWQRAFLTHYCLDWIVRANLMHPGLDPTDEIASGLVFCSHGFCSFIFEILISFFLINCFLKPNLNKI